MIIATGGGTFIDEENYKVCKQNGLIIMLWAEPEVIFERIQNDKNRPLLSGVNKYERIVELLQKRKSIYERIFHQIDTSSLNVQEVVNKVIKIFKKNNDKLKYTLADSFF